MWHLGTIRSVVCNYHGHIIYMTAEDTQEGLVLHVENGESHRQLFSPQAADRSVMRSMPHLLKRLHSCQQRGLKFGYITRVAPQGKGRHVIHGTCRGIRATGPVLRYSLLIRALAYTTRK